MIKGNQILITTSGRIKQAERKPNIYYYDIRHSDEDGFEPVTIEKRVIVNHFATIGVKRPIHLNRHGNLDLDENDVERLLMAW